MKNSKKMISLALASMMSVGLLSGCGAKEANAEVGSETEVVEEVREIVEGEEHYFEQYYEVPEAKVFEPGEHVFFLRYNYSGSAENFTSGRVDVPNGYDILEIENYTEKDGYGSQTGGVDIWYINNERVIVEPIFKDEIRNDWSRNGYYDYATFGVVMEKNRDEEIILTK